MKKVSVIIPVYNGEKYIDECLQSVCSQNYKDIEILIINDGSTDSSLERCQNWREKDSRIIIFNNENHGVSYSRNVGIEKSTGEYIAFIDADDIVSQDYIETLVTMISKPTVDCAVVKLAAFFDKKKEFTNGKSQVLLGIKAQEALHSFIGGFSGGRIYKQQVIKENCLQFNEKIAVCEDLLFNNEYFKHSEQVVYNEGIKYLYRQHGQSAYHDRYNLKWFDCIKAYKLILGDYDGQQKALPVIAYNYLRILYEAKYRAKRLKKRALLSKVKKELKNVEKYKESFSAKQKLSVFILRYFYLIVVLRRNKKGNG